MFCNSSWRSIDIEKESFTVLFRFFLVQKSFLLSTLLTLLVQLQVSSEPTGLNFFLDNSKTHRTLRITSADDIKVKRHVELCSSDVRFG